MPSPPEPPPVSMAALVPGDVDLGPAAARPALRAVWLGIVWGRLGRGDLAWACWDDVRAAEVQPWIAAERGRVLRELGLHDEAERIERPALATATDPVVGAMLRISLAADAVGRGDLDAATRRFEEAETRVAALTPGPRATRQRLRLAWVDVEVAACTGRCLRHAALLPTRGPLPAAYGAGTDFHRTKGLLFAAALADDASARRLLAEARTTAPPVLAWAVALARADRGVAGAMDQARRAWSSIVPPPAFAAAARATPTARRLQA